MRESSISDRGSTTQSSPFCIRVSSLHGRYLGFHSLGGDRGEVEDRLEDLKVERLHTNVEVHDCRHS